VGARDKGPRAVERAVSSFPMKVLVADKFEDSGRRGLAEIGCDISYEPDVSADTLLSSLKATGADVLVVRSTKVTRPMLESGKLQLVVRAGAGTNTIDVEAASERGIWVANCPGKNAVAVAELALGLMLALDRRITDGTAELKNGTWNKKEYSKARGVFGRTLGVIGVGTIGAEVIRRAQAFGMNVVAWDKHLSAAAAEELGISLLASLTEVAAVSDVVTVHLALVPETRGLIGDGVFASMKQGAIFINTSRAEVVDQTSLERAVKERGIRAGLDVFAEEPAGAAGNIEAPIFKLPGVIGTHHIGASTDQAQEAIAEETVRIVRLFKETGRPANVVNLAKKSPATHLLGVRHYDRVGVLAAVFDCLKKGGINVQETENIVFEGARAAVARIHVDRAPAAEVIDALRTCTPDVLDVSLVAL
jgi:D-3-phosphoglycerate dehydrogenase / 2-oxoglutarate reductase